MSNRHPNRVWGVGIGTAAAAAAMIGTGAADADTYDELLGQAGADLTQATQVLDQVPTAALDARELVRFDAVEQLQTSDVQQLIPAIQTFQDGLPAADQASPLLLDLDQQFVQSSQELLTADQWFLSAVDAGALTTSWGALEAQLPLIEAALTEDGTGFEVLTTDLIAQFDPSILTAF
jgi:hypothetical protein